MTVFGLKFEVHGNDYGYDFCDWLGEVTLMDFVTTVNDVGFAQAVRLVEANNA